MATWFSKGAFEYTCSFSLDDAIIPAYTPRKPSEGAVEVRSNFLVKVLETGEKRWLGSETFGAIIRSESDVREALAMRLSDYWMSPPQIEKLLDKALGLGGPEAGAVVDLEVLTAQEEGEPLEDALARAMRPAILRPFDLLTNHYLTNPSPRLEELFWLRLGNGFSLDMWARNLDKVHFLGRLYEEGFRVDDVGQGLAVMQQCGICGGEPFVGTVTAKLRCGHLFHYHCVVWPLKDHHACPILSCRHPPYELRPPLPISSSLTAPLSR
ncbi:hypothetical protein OROGR_010377 [Orobanche gracilis]